jgi:hypothetical protein
MLTNNEVCLNICESEKLKAPASDNDAIPTVVRTPPRHVNIGGKKVHVYDIVFNPAVVAR